MQHCYCANYYSAVNCHNKVSQFGDRCRLCTVMNEGVSARYESFNHQAQAQSYSSQSYQDMVRDDSSREERRGRPRERKGKDSGKSRHHS
ncbi:hypothetical protein PG999_008134 [Apiospora kogelbergensis]|uniref:Uncharacterized protein n=1 Tax=Apiospora kogelbergensis TaxID=1337665 RepID=A0AAW0QP31_9PEZI